MRISICHLGVTENGIIHPQMAIWVSPRESWSKKDHENEAFREGPEAVGGSTSVFL